MNPILDICTTTSVQIPPPTYTNQITLPYKSNYPFLKPKKKSTFHVTIILGPIKTFV